MEYINTLSKDDMLKLLNRIVFMPTKDLIISNDLWNKFSLKEQTNLICSFRKILFIDCSYTNDKYQAFIVDTDYEPKYKWDKNGRRKVVR